MRIYTAAAVGAFTAYLIFNAVMLNGEYAMAAAYVEAVTAGIIAAVYTLKKGKVHKNGHTTQNERY